MGLQSTPHDNEDVISISDGYCSNVVIRWGDGVVPGAPVFSLSGQTAEAAAKQFGSTATTTDFSCCCLGKVVGVCSASTTNTRAASICSEDYDTDNPTAEQAAIELASHGISIVEVSRAAIRYSRRGIASQVGALQRAFDVSKEPNEPNRFGYLVEIDPYAPSFTPHKHIAMGRFKHEAATVALSDDGCAVVYSGDDQRFNDDGTGDWLPLVGGSRELATWTNAGIANFTREAAEDVDGANPPTRAARTHTDTSSS